MRLLNEGTVLAAMANKLTNSSSPENAKTMAVLEGIQFVSRLLSVKLESDCQVIVNKILSKDDDLLIIRHLFYLIRFNLLFSIISKVYFIECKSNVPTHLLT